MRSDETRSLTSALAHPRGRALVALLLLAIASSTSLGGSWVYDDLHMVGNAAMDDASDVPASLTRTSADYLPPTPYATTATFRPATMLTLVATHVLAPSPLAHHLVGLALHAALVLLLLSYERRLATAWTLAVIAVALHPALAEAWLYVNGRSDLMAGLCLAGLWRALRARHRAAWAACALCALLGALSKETFVVAAPFVILASVRRRGRARVAAAGVGLALGLVLALVLRSDVQAGGSIARLLDLRIASRWPALIGLASETLLLPWPRPMRSLSHELGPAALAHAPWLLAAVVALGWLLVRRRLRAALHVAGAIAVMLPTALVSDLFWLGFDRYLTMPAILLVTACAPELRALSLDRTRALAGAGIVVVLAALTATSGLAYASHAALVDAIVHARPEDPAGHLLAASERARAGDTEGALATLGSIQSDQLAGASAHQAASLLHRLGRPDLVALVLEDAYQRDPDDPWLRLDVIGLRGAQGRFDEALDLAEPLRAEPGFCTAVRDQLAPWAESPRVPPEPRARAAHIARPCDPR